MYRTRYIPNHPVLNQTLGGPIQISKNLKGSFTKDLANFDFKLNGTKLSGDLNIQGRQKDGYWLLTSNLKIPGRKSIMIDFSNEVKKEKSI
jgi:hypothetical protein